MNILAWVLFGLLVGIVANWIDPAPSRGGWLGAIVLGIVGALVGGWIGDLIFGVGITGFNFPSFVIAVIGSIILLWIGRAFRRIPR